jgi:hypothetical protein
MDSVAEIGAKNLNRLFISKNDQAEGSSNSEGGQASSEKATGGRSSIAVDRKTMLRDGIRRV